MSLSDIFQTMDYGPAPEAAGEAEDWLDAQGRQFGHFIGGSWTRPGKNLFATKNPATGTTLAKVAQGTTKDVDNAVKAARKALGPWQKLSGFERAKVLYALARLVQKHARLLAVLETMDNGKPIRETRDIDIPLVARHFYHHAGWAQMLDSELPGYAPHGVAGQIIPWNFPLLMLAWKIAPALAAGCTVVLKPAEQTPLTAALFCTLCQKAGVPDGVVNVVFGDGRTGAEIVAHKDIDKIAFTGSSEVGRLIRQQTAGSGKALTLELGGKSPFIVFEDADLDSAVEGVVDAIWFNQGEVCCAGSRLLVAEPVAKTFIEKLTRRMDLLRVGDPLDKCTDIGALVDETQRTRVETMVSEGLKQGGSVHKGRQVPQQGCFVPPMLITDVHPASPLAREEIFGPVLVSMTFRTPKEAIELANNTTYGLAASVWSQDVDTALDLAAGLKAGVVWVNSTNQFDAAVGFGGYKQSGFGREGGREGMLAYLAAPGSKGTGPLSALKPAKATTTDTGDIDRTAKNYIGGKQARPDGGYSRPVISLDGTLIAEVGDGNRKDIRNAMEAAVKAESWSTSAAHLRAQIIYYIAENLAARRTEFAARIAAMTGAPKSRAQREVDTSVERLFYYAGYADKHDGAVHNPPGRNIAVAMNEPLGVIGIIAPQAPSLLGFISLLAPALATGNRVVLVPSDIHPLAATDFYQVLETSDVPAGVVNIVTGDHGDLSTTLADHDELTGLWYFGHPGRIANVEKHAAHNLKQVWTHNDKALDWTGPATCGRHVLDRATQVKNIWVPYGA